jgi:excisionase family DNA binding protein
MTPSDPIIAPSESQCKEDRWLTVREAALLLRVHPISIYRGCAARRITHAKAAGIGIRIDRRDLERFMEGAKVPTAKIRKAKF